MRFLALCQAEVAERHVDVVRDLGHGPAIDLFRLGRRTVSRGNGERIHVACIVEMNELFQALGVAIVKEFLREVWQKAQASFLNGDVFSSKFSSLPRISIALCLP